MNIKTFLFGLIVITSTYLYAEVVPQDTVAINLCNEAEAAYNGTNGAFMNREKAFQLYLKAAERNYLPAIKTIASFYADGNIVAPNKEKYFEWTMKAAKLHDLKAMKQVALCFYEGQGTQQNDSLAFVWEMAAAKEGDSEGMFNMAVIFENQGKLCEALEWYRKAAELGWANAQTKVSIFYMRGLCVKKDNEQAKYWYDRAVEQFDQILKENNADAQNLLATLFHDFKKYDKAIVLLNKAVENGCANAMYNLAFCYVNGQGVKIDLKKAEELYLSAIEGKYYDAAYELGHIYYEGLYGFKKKKKEGKRLLKLAAEHKNKDAQKYLNEHNIK